MWEQTLDVVREHLVSSITYTREALDRSSLAVWLGNLLATFILYNAGLVIYRLYFSPVAKFPGPKLAAATCWYEIYHDAFRHGSYHHVVAEMHKKYGPIVRISPEEIHVSDPSFYLDLYVEYPVRRSDKWSGSVGGLGMKNCTPFTTDHYLHRTRRNALNKFFSKKEVNRFEPAVQDCVKRLCDRFVGFKGTGEPVNLNHAFSALAGDIITKYCFSRCFNVIEHPYFDPEWEDVFGRFNRSIHVFKHFHWAIDLMGYIPRKLLTVMDPRLVLFFNREDVLHQQVDDIMSGKDKNRSESHATIFHDLLDNSKLPKSELTLERLRDEGSVMIGAASLSVARTLYLASYFILSDPKILSRLQSELKDAFAEYPERMPGVRELEDLPYLNAILKEALRLSPGMVTRLPRVFPDDTMKYGGWNIPPGTPISFSTPDMHENPDIFPVPQAFIPDRWLTEDEEELARYKKYWWPFSKGSRNCLGITLAWSELYLSIATVFRPGGPTMKLYETTDRDVYWSEDCFAGFTPPDSKGVRILVE